MTSWINRVGIAGLILVASLVIFAFLAGGVVVHRLESSPAAAGQQEEKQDGQAEADQGESKAKHSKQGHGTSENSNKNDDTEKD